MSERWKPEKGESYYCIFANGNVDRTVWRNVLTDKSLFERGNCFKTEEKAKAAAEKVKSLLLSLHEPTKDCNHLPKLTTEVFDRPDCPEWAKYAAVDMNGVVTFFKEKPVINKYHWWSSPNCAIKEIIHGHFFDASDWRNSLIERPAVLPDWCKVREWCWSSTMDCYFKVTEADEINGSGPVETFAEFAKNYTQLDNTPCGVLEHLNENGEWVE